MLHRPSSLRLLCVFLMLVASCAGAQTTHENRRIGDTAALARIRADLERRYAENAAAFVAKDTAAVYRLRAPGFHTVTPDGRTNSFTDMKAYTVRLFGMIERFDSVAFHIDSLSLRGDTAVAVTFQRTSRLQHLPDTPAEERHRVTSQVVQREQWVPSESGWLLWRVDQVCDQGLWIDGTLRRGACR
jgi:hypothetical protein